MKHKKKSFIAREFLIDRTAFGSPLLIIMLWASFFLNEFIFKFVNKIEFGGANLLYTLFLTFPFAAIIVVLSTFFKSSKLNFAISLILTGTVSLYYCVQLIYLRFFGYFLTFTDISETGQIAEFWMTIVTSVFRNIFWIIVFWLPFLMLIIFRKNIFKLRKTTLGAKIIVIVLALLVQSVTVGSMASETSAQQTVSDIYYYRDSYVQDTVANRFGILTMARLDLKYCFVDVPDDEPADDEDETSDSPIINNYTSSAVIGDNANIIWHTSPEYVNTDKSLLIKPNTVVKDEFLVEIENSVGSSAALIDSKKEGILLYEHKNENNIRYFALYERENELYQVLKVVIPENYNGNVEELEYEYSFTSIKKSEINYGYNIIEGIDFQAVIDSETDSNLLKLHKYFASLEPTKKNEYTGMFKGKNLIYMTCESFSPAIIDKDRTPTLYRMYNEGFKFTNYYVTDWAASTGGGEYSMATGLCALKTMKDLGSQLMQASATRNTYFPFTLGNIFSKEGYVAKSYHNHNKNLYEREKSHALWGFDYKYITKGLEMTYRWPCSDKEMIDASIDDYLTSSPFVVDYMTISGHGSYEAWTTIAKRNKSIVDPLNYCEPIKIYLAASMELEYALQTLIEKLDAEGILEDTVIVMAPDHWPYCLSEEYGVTSDQLDDFYGFKTDNTFERYHNGLIIWSASMDEQIVVDKPCTSIDILPTVLNLFGMEYDSRLLAGEDILSDSEGVAITKHNMSWVTEKGRYNTSTGVFTQNDPSEQLEDGYAKRINQKVKNKVNYSQYIILNNYYKVLFEKCGLK